MYRAFQNRSAWFHPFLRLDARTGSLRLPATIYSSNFRDGPLAVASLTVDGLVPYAHVADLTRSIQFYNRLGFVVESTATYKGELAWASLRCGDARLMIALATAPVDPERQAVLFYVHAHNVAGIRKQLLADGMEISEIRHPEYMPAGEIALYDPDGYCLVIGQPELRRAT